MKDYNFKLKCGTKIYVNFSMGGIDKDIIISDLYHKKVFNILGLYEYNYYFKIKMATNTHQKINSKQNAHLTEETLFEYGTETFNKYLMFQKYKKTNKKLLDKFNKLKNI